MGGKVAALEPTAEYEALLDLLLAEEGFEESPEPVLGLRDRGDATPLSYAQQRLWFLQQMAKESPLYNVSAALRLRGALDRRALAQSLTAILSRHEALRTVFPAPNGEPRQVVRSPASPDLPAVDLSGLEALRREELLGGMLAAEPWRPFHLDRGPLVRFLLVCLAPEEHVLLSSAHHIVCDGWSIGVLTQELTRLYAEATGGEAAALPPLALQYADFALWQREWLESGALDEQLGYWRETLAGELPRLELPADRPRLPVPSYRGAQRARRLPAATVEALEAFSQRRGGTLFMALLAVFKILLSRYTGETDILVGNPVAGRNRAEIEPLIGFFVNTVVLRSNLSGGPSFAELFGRVRTATLDALAHQDVPFDRLVEALQPERNLSHQALYQMLFVLQNAPLELPRLGALELERQPLERRMSESDLGLWVEPDGDGLEARFEYMTDLFDATTVDRMLDGYLRLLEGALSSPEVPVSELPLLSDAEWKHLLATAEETARPTPEAGGTARTYPDDPYPGVGFVGHVDGVIRNNFVAAADSRLFDSPDGFDTGIGLEQAHGAVVAHNTVASTETPLSSSIEWRFSNTLAAVANNLVSASLLARDGGVASLSGNLDWSPLAWLADVATGDLHLSAAASSAVDAGTSLAAGVADDDIDGEARVGPRDVGADENVPRIFSDGFESGDLSAWSAAVG